MTETPLSDLITRLRGLAAAEHDDLSVGEEAAETIERLRDSLAEYSMMRGSLLEKDALAEQIEAAQSLMEKAHEDHCAAEQRFARVYEIVTNSLTIIAECSEEHCRDWTTSGYEASEPIAFAGDTGQRARAALAVIEKHRPAAE